MTVDVNRTHLKRLSKNFNWETFSYFFMVYNAARGQRCKLTDSLRKIIIVKQKGNNTYCLVNKTAAYCILVVYNIGSNAQNTTAAPPSDWDCCK